MKIDTTKNFTKHVGSLRGARNLASVIAKENGDRMISHSTGVRGKRICFARGEQKNFRWYYDGDTKVIQVIYTDGRPEPQPKEPKETYYIVWVEGIEPKGGEKICTLNDREHTYTTDMTRALRVKPEHLERVKGILRSRGVADWVLDNPNSFIKTHYAPRGTVYKL